MVFPETIRCGFLSLHRGLFDAYKGSRSSRENKSDKSILRNAGSKRKRHLPKIRMGGCRLAFMKKSNTMEVIYFRKENDSRF